MSFSLSVKKREQSQVLSLGGRLLPDGKTLIIPDEIRDINAFGSWLPKREGFIVQRPYFVVRAKWHCWKCKEAMQTVALGARCYHVLGFTDDDMPQWVREEGVPILFTEVDYLDATISRNMQENYPFFRQVYSGRLRKKEWGNCCMQCGALQEEDDDWRYGHRTSFDLVGLEEPMELRVIYFNLDFDYYLRAGHKYSTLYGEVIR